MQHLYRFIATIGLILALGIPQGIAAQKSYGALAFSPSRGVDGYSFNFKTQSAAQRMALQQCKARARDCRVVANFSRGCAALAVGRQSGWGAGTGAGRAQARSKAISACRKFASGRCVIQRSVCS